MTSTPSSSSVKEHKEFRRILQFAIGPGTTNVSKFVLAVFHDYLHEFEKYCLFAQGYEPKTIPEVFGVLELIKLYDKDPAYLAKLESMSPRWNYFVRNIDDLSLMLKNHDRDGLERWLKRSTEHSEVVIGPEETANTEVA